MLVLLSVLFYLFIFISLFNIIHIAMYLVGANIYDIRTFRLQRKHKVISTLHNKPLVSVLIPAYNEEKVIERSLQSVWNNTYENIEIIVISDGSTDGTASAVQRYINSRTRVYSETSQKIVRTKNGLKRVWQRGQSPINRRIRLIQQKNAGKAAALNNGLRYYAKGELIMTLDADSLLHKRAITNAVRYFDDPTIAGLAANVRIIEEPTPLGLLQRFEHMLAYRSKKFFSIANCELIVGGVASTYRRDILDSVGHYDTNTVTEDIGLSMKIAARGNLQYRLIYASDVAAMTEGVGDFKTLLKQRYRWKLGNLQNIVKYRKLVFSTNDLYSKTLSWYRLPVAFLSELLLLLEPLALAYVIYLSIHFMTLSLFLGAYMTITAYVLLTVWPDEHLTFWGKVKASFQAPLIYFVFYIMNIVQLVSIIRCLINRDRIVNLTHEKPWISPERAGRKAVSFS
jgi:cellulose synthase/poly-beta-1,6-N-acetylglucosamine synthase-like glycosyltransferase